MKINKADFLKALSKVLPAVSGKPLEEQTDHFVLDKEYIRTYNGEAAISYPFKTDLSLAVKADVFFQLISKIEGEEFELEVKENAITISAGRLKAEVVSAAVKCPVVLIKSRKKDFHDLPKNFSDALRFCSLSVGEDEADVLGHLWVKNQYVVSSDAFRVTKYEMDSKMDTEMLISGSAVRQLPKYSPITYAVEDVWIHFKNSDGAIFSSRVFVGEYPEEVWGLFTIKGEEVPIPDGLAHAAEEAKIFTQDADGNSDSPIRLIFKAGKLRCLGEGPLGHAEESFKIDYKKKDFEVPVPPDALIEILAHAEKKMHVGDDKIYFSGPNFEHVIALT